jgi:hypothetical protein
VYDTRSTADELSQMCWRAIGRTAQEGQVAHTLKHRPEEFEQVLARREGRLEDNLSQHALGRRHLTQVAVVGILAEELREGGLPPLPPQAGRRSENAEGRGIGRGVCDHLLAIVELPQWGRVRHGG